ncbi:DUF1036 domain-containing protein [Paenibacillus agilis]|uniref:DUF1036 domain-containing protein n=1 Tax=Paenibacillus agilis TaxID=3020863 RepID=A0A559IVG7_9BACL|nr:DUF1036 domain-containing protein [Paenibacillus agilis]TVX91637.1 DUF1036 domain-containing protein [Paenibacillus agilis]
MSLYFRNSTNSAVRLVIFYTDINKCGIPIVGARGILSGWYRLEPGQTREIVRGSIGGRTINYYAENIARTRVWSGNFLGLVPNYTFSGCWGWSFPDRDLCENCRRVRFRTLDIQPGLVNYTVNFITSSSQRQTNLKDVVAALPSKKVKAK